MAEDYNTLRAAVDRIMGTPAGGDVTSAWKGGTTGGGVELAPRVPFSGDFYSISNPDVATISNPVAPVAAAPPPVTTTVTTPTPTQTYAQRLYSDLALSGVTGANADLVVNSSLQGGGWDTSTPYDPNNSLMNINPNVAPGTVVTK